MKIAKEGGQGWEDAWIVKKKNIPPLTSSQLDNLLIIPHLPPRPIVCVKVDCRLCRALHY